MIEIGNGRFGLGDCLDLMQSVPDGSVDMILCDLPYGTTACSWDSVIPFEPLWREYWRIAKPNAAVVLTASQPFTSALIMSQIDRFKYEWIWEKEQAHSPLNAKHQPLKTHENVCVFSRAASTHSNGVLMNYNPQMTTGEPYRSPKKKDGSHKFHGSIETKEVKINSGTRYPKTIQFYKRERGLHPTQKPVALFEYLIRTYTNEGDTVLDNCMGSGTTAIAAENTGRRWWGIEQDSTYYGKACERIARTVLAR